MFNLNKRWQLFAMQPFRWYVISCFLVTLGGGLLYINLTWLSLQTHDSVRSVAYLMLSFWLPVVLIGPLGGVVADRYNRRNILIVGSFARAIILMLFALIWAVGFAVVLWQMCLLNVVMGLALSCVFPALMGYVREIVPEQHLLYANSTVDIAYETGNIIGMGSAGILLAVFSLFTALSLDALCFAISGVGLLISKTPKRTIEKTVKSNWFASIYHDYRSGIAYLRQNVPLCFLYSVQLFVMAVFMVSPVLLAPFAKNILHANVGQFGELEAAISIGVVVGGVVSPSLAERFGTIKIVFIELVGMLMAYALFSVNLNLGVADALNVVIGLGLSVWPLMLTLAQSKTKLAFQGRVQSTFNSLSGVVILLIYTLVGGYGPSVSVKVLYAIQVVFSAAAIVFLLLYWRVDQRAKTVQNEY